MVPVWELLGGKGGKPEEELRYITGYLKLSIPLQEAVQMLQERDDEKAPKGICSPLAVGTVVGGRCFCADICQSIGPSLRCSASNGLSVNSLR